MRRDAPGFRSCRREEDPTISVAPMVDVTLHVHGRNSVNELAATLSELDGVRAVLASDVNAVDE